MKNIKTMLTIIMFIIIFISILFLFTGCINKSNAVETSLAIGTQSELIQVQDNSIRYDIYYHKDTKVMYLIVYGSGISVTPMLDIDGKPLLWQGN